MTAATETSEVEALIRTYIQHWSARDVATIWSRIYRLDPSSRIKSQADLQAMLDDLAAEGFERTELHAVHADLLAPDRALAKIRFTRFRTDGTPMSSTDRGAEYEVRKFADGWRITSVRATD